MSDVTLRIALVQEAGDLDPDVNRSRLADLVPDDADLVVLPEAFARDFGSPGDEVSAFAEEVGGPFDTELTRVAEQRGTTVVAGSFERSDDPGRPFNTLLVRGRSRASYGPRDRSSWGGLHPRRNRQAPTLVARLHPSA